MTTVQVLPVVVTATGTLLSSHSLGPFDCDMMTSAYSLAAHKSLCIRLIGHRRGLDDDPQPRPAPAPFDKPQADVTLRTSDGVEFRVFRWILKDASPIFAGMFTLPRAPSMEGDSHPPASAYNNGEPPSTIKVSEDSTTLVILLRMFYPCPPLLTFPEMDAAKPVLIALAKYRLAGAMPQILNALLPHIRTNPLRMYALAVRYNIHDLVQVAARAFLAVEDTAVYSEELEEISAGAYVRLMMYRKACGDAVDALFRGVPWMSENRTWCWYTCDNCIPHSCSGVQRSKMTCHCGTAPWFTIYWNQVRDLMKITPSTEALEDPDLMEVDELRDCVTCRLLQSHKQRQRYTRLLVAEVERRISNVSNAEIITIGCMLICICVVGSEIGRAHV